MGRLAGVAVFVLAALVAGAAGLGLRQLAFSPVTAFEGGSWLDLLGGLLLATGLALAVVRGALRLGLSAGAFAAGALLVWALGAAASAPSLPASSYLC